MAKIKLQNTDVEAVKEFTDREDPQEAFERKFRVLSENWREEYYVLCYYGIGGVGKTSFLDKLCRVIRGVEGNETRLLDKIDCNYIRYDFDAKSSGTDKLSILLSLRRQLGDVDKNFKFFRFDSAVLLYAKKNGMSIEKDETAQSLLESNPWMDAVVSTVGTVPVVGWVAGVIQAIDKSAKTAREAIGKHLEESRYKYHLNEIDGMEPPKILENLHRYFIEDMKYNMQQVAVKPLVVFLDTYEKYIDTVNNERRMLIEDYWLRKGRTSVIQSVPGVLWVIAGREKLYWEEDDNNWSKTVTENPFSGMSEEEKEALARTDLEQHLLGDLSLKDAVKFLQKAGVHDAVLCEQLHELTEGTPLYLDMCVDTYHELCNQGVVPEIGQFGEDIKQLTNRYLFRLNEANREMAYFLACLGTWNDESVRRIAGEATTLRWYTYAKYEAFVDHSFIIKNPDGSYYMHETVRSAALKNADKEIIEEIGRIKLSVVKESVEADETLDSGATFGEYTKTLAENSLSYEEFYENLKTAKRKFESLEDSGAYDALYTSAGEVFRGAIKNYSATGLEYIARSEYGNALKLKGFLKEALEVVSEIPLAGKVSDIEEEDWLTVKARIAEIYRINGMYQESLEMDKQVLELRKQVLGEEHPDTLKSMYGLVCDYYYIGEGQKALELDRQLLEVRTRVLGEEHPDTLTSMNGLATCYAKMGEEQKARELYERTLELRKKVLGEEHPNTLQSMYNLAISYNATGEKQKALELYERTLELSRKVLGEEHPDTLASMNNLANSYNAMGEKQKALELRERTLELRRKVLGEEHPDTLETMRTLARCYNGIGEKQKEQELKVQEAEIQKRLLEKRKRELGEEHPDTLETMRTLARCYNGIGEKQKEQELKVQEAEIQKRLLEKRKRELGEEHPDTLASMHNLANSYAAIGEKQKARELREQTLELRRKVLGEEHPDTITSLGDLAGSYYNMGEKQKAYEMWEKALDQRKRVQGEEHPDTKKAESLLKIRRLLEGKKKPETNFDTSNDEEFEKTQSDALVSVKKEVPKPQATPLTPDEKEVVELRAQLSETNNPTLRCKLAARHLEGRGIELNAVKAFELYREAAEQGNCAALFCQGILCLQGRGTSQDVHVAFDLLKEAAEQGHANAQFMISLFYGTGRVVVKDDEMAAKWYERALQNGELKKAYDANKLFLDCEDARSNLGLLVEWHEHTSYQEFPISRCNLGYMYETGRGMDADTQKAAEWYAKAAGQGDEVAKALLEGLKKPGFFGKLFGKGRKKE